MKKQQNKWQKKSKRDIETYDRTEKQHLISQINGNFALEGMSLTEKDKQELKDLQRENPEETITIYINSPGGEVSAGLALYDVIQAVSCPVRTVCVGLAASMAAILFLCGKQRDILPHARVMIHDPLVAGNISGSALRVESISRDLMKVREVMGKIIAEHTGKNLDEILARTATDCYFDAEEAVEFGMADRIIERI